MDELVVGKQDGRRQRRKEHARMFTPAKRQRFLDALAMTCNVEAASAHAGVHRSTPYAHRTRDPQFVAQWRDAVAAGYDRLEALVLEHGGAGQPLEPADPGRIAEDGQADALPPFDFERALKILALYRNKRDSAPGTHRGAPRRNATREETNAALMKALAAARKRIAKASGEN